jgi:hypothetical protein
MLGISSEEKVDRLWKTVAPGRHERIFALLDAARHDSIFPAVMGADCLIACLYRDVPDALVRVAPYLVEIQPKSAFADWLFRRWGDHWGILLATRARLDELYRHFRRFLIVKDPAGRRLYFRYYDPRVLRNYLPTCNAAELETLFGPVEHYLVEDGDSSGLLRFSRDQGALKTERTPLLPG